MRRKVREDSGGREAQGYSDYVDIVRSRLKNYKKYKVLIDNRKHELAKIERHLSAVYPPIAKYSNDAGGGSELNATEMGASKLMELEHQRRDLETDVKDLQGIVEQIDRTLLGLSDQEQYLVKGRYIDGRSWTSLGVDCGYSPDWVYRKASKALQDMAEMIFGGKAIIEQGSFIFAT